MATYYIRHFTGNDSNDGLSADTAWKTFVNCNTVGTVLKGGDIIYVGSGMYHNSPVGHDGEIDVHRNTTVLDTGQIQFIADKTGEFTGDAGEVGIMAANLSDYISIDGFTIIGDVTSEFTDRLPFTGFNEALLNCQIYGVVTMQHCSGTTVIRNCILGLGAVFGEISSGGVTLSITFIGGNRSVDVNKHYSENVLAGKIVSEFNTIFAPANNLGQAVKFLVAGSGAYINNRGCWFKNNIIVECALARTVYLVSWGPQKAEDWDWNWKNIDNNLYAYSSFNNKFTELKFFAESAPNDFTFGTFASWASSTVSPDAYGTVNTGDGSSLLGNPLFKGDFRHISAGSPAINGAYVITDAHDFEDDNRGNDFQDIGADEFVDEPPGNNWIYTSKVYGQIADTFIPTKAFFKTDYLIYPNDYIRILVSWNGGFRWWEIVNTNTSKFLVDQELTIPGSVRGKNYLFKIEIFQHASNAGLPDFGVNDLNKIKTELATQADIPFGLTPGMEVDYWSIQFPGERAAVAIVDKNRSYSVPIYPGSFRAKLIGGSIKKNREVIVTKGFSNTFARFGEPHCGVTNQFTWSDFEMSFYGVDWATYGVLELFNDETGRMNPEPAPKPANVRCGFVVKGQTGVRMFEMYCNPKTLK